MFNIDNNSDNCEEILKKDSGSSNVKNKSKNTHSYDIIVFCHLRWGFVYQRPQHIISRLSQKYNILFVEEPIHYSVGEEKTYDMDVISESLHVFKPKVNSIEEIGQVLKGFLNDNSANIGWFYSPAFSILIPEFDFDTIVHDCMDELSLFKGADSKLIEQEKYLLSKADVVFTGGKALYESKQQKNPNVYCFPSSVDREHFEKSKGNIFVPEDIKNISAPIVGYFGVIDERIDLDLLKTTAHSSPDVSFVMIGPLAKIGEDDLPRASNIHYLGMKSYDELPNYLKVFDIAMMPFALNEATKYISPTKTLEYMAAGKPIISTAIKDVVRDYKDCTYIIKDSEDFVTAINEILDTKKDNRERDYEGILAKTSWNATVEKMEQIIKEQTI